MSTSKDSSDYQSLQSRRRRQQQQQQQQLEESSLNPIVNPSGAESSSPPRLQCLMPPHQPGFRHPDGPQPTTPERWPESPPGSSAPLPSVDSLGYFLVRETAPGHIERRFYPSRPAAQSSTAATSQPQTEQRRIPPSLVPSGDKLGYFVIKEVVPGCVERWFYPSLAAAQRAAAITSQPRTEPEWAPTEQEEREEREAREAWLRARMEREEREKEKEKDKGKEREKEKESEKGKEKGKGKEREVEEVQSLSRRARNRKAEKRHGAGFEPSSSKDNEYGGTSKKKKT